MGGPMESESGFSQKTPEHRIVPVATHRGLDEADRLPVAPRLREPVRFAQIGLAQRGARVLDLLAGRSIDPDGVDSVYFEAVGAPLTFSPYSPPSPVDTVAFGIPISTTSSGGDSILVLVFATDAMGNRGDTAVRRLIVE